MYDKIFGYRYFFRFTHYMSNSENVIATKLINVYDKLHARVDV